MTTDRIEFDAIAAIGEFPRAGHDLLRAVQRSALDFKGRRLTVIAHESGLRIEHVDRARSAAYINKDNPLRFGGEVGRLRPQIVGPLLGQADSAANSRSCCSMEFNALRRTLPPLPATPVYASKIVSWLSSPQ